MSPVILSRPALVGPVQGTDKNRPGAGPLVAGHLLGRALRHGADGRSRDRDSVARDRRLAVTAPRKEGRCAPVFMSERKL